jgi:hypothetical protein
MLVPMLLGLYAVRRPDPSWLHARGSSIVALGCSLLIWAMWRLGLRVAGVDDVPLAERAGWAATLFATARYEVRAVAGALVPFGWSPEYAPEAPASAYWLLPLAGIVLVTSLLARRRFTRVPAMGLVVLLTAALATSPLVGPANESADRFLFVSVLGAGMVWGFLADVLVRRAELRRPWRMAALVAALAPSVLVAQKAAAAWASDFTLWRVATERAPGSYRAWSGWSRALRKQGRFDEADAAVERALALHPSSVTALVTRAYNRLARGDIVGARRDIARVRELGHPNQKGLRYAAHCAALEPARARACVGAHPPDVEKGDERP